MQSHDFLEFLYKLNGPGIRLISPPYNLTNILLATCGTWYHPGKLIDLAENSLICNTRGRKNSQKRTRNSVLQIICYENHKRARSSSKYRKVNSVRTDSDGALFGLLLRGLQRRFLSSKGIQMH